MVKNRARTSEVAVVSRRRCVHFLRGRPVTWKTPHVHIFDLAIYLLRGQAANLTIWRGRAFFAREER